MSKRQQSSAFSYAKVAMPRPWHAEATAGLLHTMDLRAVPADPPVIAYPATAGQILQLILSGQANSRSEIGRLTGLSRTAVTARVNQLAALGLIVEGATT